MVENGWMMERRGFNGKHHEWWTGIHGVEGLEDMGEWSDDSLKCVRFARRVDAEMVIAGVLNLRISNNVLATEHGWGL